MASPFDVPDIAHRQGGVFTPAQAMAQGWTARQVRRRIDNGRWASVAGIGLARPRDSWTAFQLAIAVTLTWPDCVLSHRTAALLHRMPVGHDGVAHVITGRGRRSGRRIQVHVGHTSETVTVPPGVRATDVDRTIADCLVWLPMGEALDLLAWLVPRRLFVLDALPKLAAARSGLPGVAQMRTLVRICRSGALSAAEWRLHQLLLEAGVLGWEAGGRVIDATGAAHVVDVLFARERLAIEVDGWRAHSGIEAFQADRRRQNALVSSGFTVLRFTWNDITARPDHVVCTIRETLNRLRTVSS